MADVRLKVAMIIDGKLHSRGTVLDEKLVPERLRTETHVDDLKNREGKVLLLRDLSFMSLPKPDSSGVLTSYPTQVSRGELFDLARVPASQRQSLVEGSDYKTDWTFEQQAEIQRTQEDIYTEATPEAEPAVSTGNRSRFYRNR